jgi:PAS domain S-box-containing protein
MKDLDLSGSLATGDLITGLAHHLSDGLITVNHSGRIIFVNESASAITGYAREEMLARRVEELFPPSVAAFEQTHPLARALETKQSVTYHSQRCEKRIELNVVPAAYLLERKGLAVSAIVLLRNVNAGNKSNENNSQVARMRLLGQLTMGIAHDFNNALTSIICNCQLVSEIFDRLTEGTKQSAAKYSTEPSAVKYLDDITRVSRKAADFIRTLLAYARQQQLSREPIDLNEAVTDTLYLTRKLLGERVTATFQAEENLCLIYAERSQIDQVLWNLLVNARDAMPHGGQLLVETAFVTLDESFTETRAWAKPGDFVRLSVSDTGTGMDQETLARIFDLFFTTKAEGDGSGLGLPTVYGIVKQHNGYIDVQSDLAKGTRFDVYLPLAEAHHRPLPSHSSAPVRAASASPPKKRLILVAEDNDNVRVLFKRILSRGGSRVITVNAGDKALKLFKKLRGQRERVDLVILDVGLPGKDGRTVCQEIHATDPQVPVLLTSGYGIPFKQDQSITEAGYEFLAKPFDGTQLLARIGEMLEKSEHRNLPSFARATPEARSGDPYPPSSR